MKLRDYQEKAVADIETAWLDHRRVCLQIPTGGGKTVIAAELAARHATSMMIVHRQELMAQTIEKYNVAGIDCGVIAAGHPFNPVKKHYVAMVQTLAKRMKQYPKWDPELLIVDECHLSLAATYDKVFEHYPNAKVLGLTATPTRLDGKGLGNKYDVIITGPSITSLIEKEHLADYMIYGPPEQMDLSNVHTLGGDYKLNELNQEAGKATYTANAVEQYKKHLLGKRAIVFAVTIEHGKQVTEAFNNGPIAASMLDGTSSDDERATIMAQFKKGEILVLVNVQLFVEGLDCPDCAGIILLRPTKSLTRYLQSVGRGMRPKSDKGKLIILDHAGNYAHHGLPDREREYTLESKQSKGSSERGMGVKCCPECFRVIKGTDRECSCGYSFVPKGVEVIEADGQLVEVKRVAEAPKPLAPWGIRFWNAVREAVEMPAYKRMKELRIVAERAGMKPGMGFYLYKAFVEGNRAIPTTAGWVKL